VPYHVIPYCTVSYCILPCFNSPCRVVTPPSHVISSLLTTSNPFSSLPSLSSHRYRRILIGGCGSSGHTRFHGGVPRPPRLGRVPLLTETSRSVQTCICGTLHIPYNCFFIIEASLLKIDVVGFDGDF
jgi:hypothetical protein